MKVRRKGGPLYFVHGGLNIERPKHCKREGTYFYMMMKIESLMTYHARKKERNNLSDIVAILTFQLPFAE